MKLRNIFLAIITSFTVVTAPVPVLVGTAAAVDCGHSPAAQEVLGGLSGDQVGDNCGAKRVNNLFANIVQIMSLLVGVASVIVIIYAGFKYITSSGEQSRVANAKSTLLYALIGLAVAALAQFMIHFVLFQTNKL
jgi:cytochrome bd-type quinol oxidase subunit 2